MGKKYFVPLSEPNFEGNECKYVDDAVSQGWVSTGGKYIKKLEGDLASFLKVPTVAAVQSGTAALHLSLIEAGVKPGDAVIVPTITFIAAVNPVRYCYAEPIFMDCDDSLCIDPLKLRAFCEKECQYDSDTDRLLWEDSNRTFHHVKAVVVVHVFGNMADMDEICSIAKQYGMMVIEDATEALGTYYISGKYNGIYAGTIGDFGAYSFNGNKIITTGGGGAVVGKNPEITAHLRYLSTQAKDDPHYYIHNEIGYNYRMTNVQAAIGVAQIEELPEFVMRKNHNYDLYADLFNGYKLCRLLPFRDGVYSNKWFYSLLINRERITASLRKIITGLEEYGVQSRSIWGLINEQKPYKNAYAYRIEKAKYYADRVINIPASTNLTEDDIQYVAEQVKSVMESYVE